MNTMNRGQEVRREIRIDATPATVFALLTDVAKMKSWLAAIVDADPRPGGVFRIADPSGIHIEGTYLEVIPDRKVVFTWGGVEDLQPGESTVEFLLEEDGAGTLVRLRHYGIPGHAVDKHERGWELGGLPKLKAVAEGRDPGGLCLGSLHDHEQRAITVDTRGGNVGSDSPAQAPPDANGRKREPHGGGGICPLRSV